MAIAQQLERIVLLTVTMQTQKKQNQYSVLDAQYATVSRNRPRATSTGQPEKQDRWADQKLWRRKAPEKILTRTMF